MDIINISNEIIALLFFGALFAGCIDAICGGGGMISIPLLMLSGLTPSQALAVNKLQGSIGAATSSFYFYKKGAFNLKEVIPLALGAGIGGLFGTLTVYCVGNDMMSFLLPVLIMIVMVFFIFSKEISADHVQQRIGVFMYACIFSLAIGWYDGFFGPISGILYMLSLVMLLGFKVTKATGVSKVLNLSSNFISLMLFIYTGEIVLKVAIYMCFGEFIGAFIGSQIVFLKGIKVVKPMMITACILMTSKIIISSVI